MDLPLEKKEGILEKYLIEMMKRGLIIVSPEQGHLEA